MFHIQLLAVGKQKEAHLLDAQKLYEKRLQPFCQFQFVTLPAVRLPDSPSEKEIQKALSAEAQSIRKHARGLLLAMCIEGRQYSSEAFSRLLTQELPLRDSAVTFVTGSSYGLHESIRQEAFQRVSMSEMTFPHALASVMLLEQIYRAYQIAGHTGYHK